jgi:cell division transport system permease protein
MSWKHALASLGRHPWGSLGCALAISAALAVPGGLWLLGFGAQALEGQARASLEVHLFLDAKVDEPQARALARELQGWGEVGSAQVVSPQDHLKALQARDPAIQGLEAGLLPWTVALAPKEPAGFVALLQKVEPLKQRPALLESVEAGDPQAAALVGTLPRLRWLSWAAAALVGLGSLLVVSNAVGLSVVKRRDEIELLRQLGARERQVLWPFFQETFLLGALGGVLGGGFLVGVLAVARGLVERALPALVAPSLGETSAYVVGASVLVGLLLAWVGAYLSARQQLRHIDRPHEAPRLWPL